MITMIKNGGDSVPSIAVPEIITDTEDLRILRDALFEMLEVVMSDDDLKFVTPSNSLYYVACIIRELTRDIEKDMRKGGEV